MGATFLSHPRTVLVLLGILFFAESYAENRCSLPYYISAPFGYDTSGCAATVGSPMTATECSLSCNGTAGFVGVSPAVSCDQDGGLFRLTRTCNKLNFALSGSNVPYTPRIQFGLAVYAGTLYLCGGIDPTNSSAYFSTVYFSNTATSWSMLGQSGLTFGERAGMAMVVTGTLMIMICGRTSIGATSLVHYTNNGYLWTQMSTGVISPARYGHGAVLFSGNLWLFGGYANTSTTLGDVWKAPSASSGSGWTKVTVTQPFPDRADFASVVFQNQMWVLGGYQASTSTYFDSAYNSVDGIAWTQAQPTGLGFSARSQTAAAVLGNQLYVLAGKTSDSAYLRDAWTTSDGRVWTQWGDQSYPTQAGHGVVVWKNWLLLLPGASNTPALQSYSYYTTGSSPVCALPDVSYGYNSSLCPATISNPLDPMSCKFQCDSRIQFYGPRPAACDGTGTFTTQCKALHFIEPNPAPSYSARHSYGLVVFSDKIWLTGGWAGTVLFADVWSSSDGPSWTNVVTSAAFGTRAGMGLVATSTMLVLVAGTVSSSGTVTSDVYTSADGSGWIRASTGQFTGRYFHGVVVYNGSIWAIAGVGANNVYLSDVLKSTNGGVSWSQVATTTAIGAICNFGLVVFKNAMWALGGYFSAQLSANVLTSIDGITWSSVVVVSTDPFTGRASAASVVFQDQLWVIAGGGSSGSQNDVITSVDGQTWVNWGSQEFTRRQNHRAVVFHDQIWMSSGQIGSSYALDREAWTTIGPRPASTCATYTCLLTDRKANADTLLCAGYCNETTCCQGPTDCQAVAGYFIPGPYISLNGSASVSRASAAACCAKCLQTSGCAFWTFDEPAQLCYLPKFSYNVTARSGWTSGGRSVLHIIV